MKIPFLGIERYYLKNKSEILEITNHVFSSGKYLASDENSGFEEKIASFCNRKFARLVGSCTDALFFALKCLDIKSGDEVLVTDLSFIASASPIIRVGAKPVFIDIDENNYMMSLSSLEKKVTSKTKAIIAVHLFGQMIDINYLTQISEKFNIPIVEDAAQALGSNQGKFKAGSIGAISCISFDPTKIIGAFGNAGCVLFDDPDMINKIELLRYHGRQNNDFLNLGYNSRVSSIQSALLSYQLDNIEENVSRRNEIANTYTRFFSQFIEIKTPIIEKNNVHTFHKYVISTKYRDELKTFCLDKGIETKIHYEKPLHTHGIFNGLGYKKLKNNNVEKICSRLLSLPIFPELTEVEIDFILNIIYEFFNNVNNRSR